MLLLVPLASLWASELYSQEALQLWYRNAAAKWEEALPLGNGRLGAMVFGGVAKERIQLNEISIWAGPPCPEPKAGGAAVLA
ncbi:MAG TPA: glycoside hydrolase N-terminal domain-containing protein, partial [Candidatus Sulfotelmatobacter sp.]|nr:glycoside hydrolase N-terminal domain-containing protein [Candidatus Sulfotelmatobacter sp.]